MSGMEDYVTFPDAPISRSCHLRTMTRDSFGRLMLFVIRSAGLAHNPEIGGLHDDGSLAGTPGDS